MKNIVSVAHYENSGFNTESLFEEISCLAKNGGYFAEKISVYRLGNILYFPFDNFLVVEIATGYLNTPPRQFIDINVDKTKLDVVPGGFVDSCLAIVLTALSHAAYANGLPTPAAED